MYFLTKTGADFLQRELRLSVGQVHFPASAKPLFQRDLFHRLASVDFHIQVSEWAQLMGVKTLSFRSYFMRDDQCGLPSHFLTSSGLLYPDAIATISLQ